MRLHLQFKILTGKENVFSQHFPGLHIKAHEDIHDVITLNFYNISVQGIFITIMNTLYIHYTESKTTNKNYQNTHQMHVICSYKKNQAQKTTYKLNNEQYKNS